MYVVRIVKDIKTKYFYALKIMKKARIVRLKQIGKESHIFDAFLLISILITSFFVSYRTYFE